MLSFLLSIYLFGYLLEIRSVTYSDAVFWNQVQYLSLPFIPAVWLLLAMVYSGTRWADDGKNISFLFVVPVLTFVIRITNEYHSLLYASLTLVDGPDLTVLRIGKGPWYFVHSTYVLAAFVYAAVAYFTKLRLRFPSRTAGYRVLLTAALFPLSGLLLLMLDRTYLGLDYVALILSVSIVLLLVSLFRYDILRLRSLARTMIFAGTADVMIILDNERRLMDHNPAAEKFFPELAAASSGQDLGEIPGLFPEIHETVRTGEKVTFQRHDQDLSRHYTICSREVISSRNYRVGFVVTMRDITEDARKNETLRLSEERYRLLAEKMSDVIWILDMNSHEIRYISSSVFRHLGYRPDELTGRSLSDLVSEESMKYFTRVMPERLQTFHKGSDLYFQDEVEQLHKDGRVVLTGVTSRFMQNTFNGNVELIGVGRDITREKKAHEKLVEQAMTDSLTALANRHVFLVAARTEFTRRRRYGSVFSLILLDVDHFKRVNDTWGHAAGDEVLRRLSRQIRNQLRDSDLAGRLGGEEFALILPETDTNGAFHVSETLRKRIEDTEIRSGTALIRVTISTGIVMFSTRFPNFEAMMKAADVALYESKETGRNRSTVATTLHYS